MKNLFKTVAFVTAGVVTGIVLEGRYQILEKAKKKAQEAKDAMAKKAILEEEWAKVMREAEMQKSETDKEPTEEKK